MFRQRNPLTTKVRPTFLAISRIDRRLNIAVENGTQVARPEPEVDSLPTCENGVCSLNWKPQKPAA